MTDQLAIPFTTGQNCVLMHPGDSENPKTSFVANVEIVTILHEDTSPILVRIVENLISNPKNTPKIGSTRWVVPEWLTPTS